MKSVVLENEPYSAGFTVCPDTDFSLVSVQYGYTWNGVASSCVNHSCFRIYE